MRGLKCCICRSKATASAPHITLHTFPKDENIRKNWISTIKKSDTMSLKIKRISGGSRICNKHVQEIQDTIFSNENSFDETIPSIIYNSDSSSMASDESQPFSNNSLSIDEANNNERLPVGKASKSTFKLSSKSKKISKTKSISVKISEPVARDLQQQEDTDNSRLIQIIKTEPMDALEETTLTEKISWGPYSYQ